MRDPGLPSQGPLLFNRPARGLLSKFSRPPMMFNYDENNHAAFIKRQPHVNIDMDIYENSLLLPTGSTVAGQC